MTWPTAIVHGDGHPGNVVVTAAGPILVDFDLAGAGPAMWDLTIPVVHHRRFGAPGHMLSAFFAAYGSDPGDTPDSRSWSGCRSCCASPTC
jgi:Ser/Thr protein kinase RdoA (MazF antagonist)